MLGLDLADDLADRVANCVGRRRLGRAPFGSRCDTSSPDVQVNKRGLDAGAADVDAETQPARRFSHARSMPF